jgi:hypothetical protein
VRDKGYAVFVENSIGYHRGVQKLVEFAGELIVFAGKDSVIPTIGKELPRFSDFFRYPGNRRPAQGDTFRRSNASGNETKISKPYPNPGCVVLPKAGYAIVKGNHHDSSFMVSMLATSLCRTHKHEDNLSFTVFFDGLEWLIDPSYYSHEYKAPLPAYLRSAAAHNNLALPGRSYSIDPRVANIDGNTVGSNFVIKGQHSSYGNVLIRREIRGSIDRLELNILDRAIAQTPEVISDDLRLFLHFGEGIEAKLQGNYLQLTHSGSKYRLEMFMPNDKCMLHYGELAEDNIKGITGLGFLKHTSIYTLECEVPFETDLSWALRVNMAQDAL